MKDLFLSCVHVGSPLFTLEDKLISILEGPYIRIFLLGDIFDSWEMSWKRISRKYSKLIEALRRISEKKPVIFTIGNHDFSREKMQKEFPNIKVVEFTEIVYDDNIPIYLTHGDKFDSIFIRNNYLSKPLYYIFASPFSHVFKLNLRDFLKTLIHDLTCRFKGVSLESIITSAEKKALSNNSRIVMGHTHLPKVVVDPMFIYANPGDWIYSDTYLEYDLEKSYFILRDIYEKGEPPDRKEGFWDIFRLRS